MVTGSPIAMPPDQPAMRLKHVGEEGDAERLEPGVEPVGGQGEEGVGHQHQPQRREHAVELRIEPESLTPVGRSDPGVLEQRLEELRMALAHLVEAHRLRVGAVARDRAEADHQTNGIWSSG